MDENAIRLIVNGKTYGSIDKNEIMKYVLGVGLLQLQYMSKEAMVSWIYECCNIIDEVSTWVKLGNIKRRATVARKYLIKNQDKMSRERTMEYFTNLILASQGLTDYSNYKFVRGSK